MVALATSKILIAGTGVNEVGAAILRENSIMNRTLFGVFIICCLSGCVTTQRTVKGDAYPAESKSYVAGRFVLSHYEWAPRMAVVLRREGTAKDVYIELKRFKVPEDKDMTVVEVEPGRYELVDVVKFSGSGDGIISRVPFSDFRYNRVFDADLNHVVYIGSYDGQSTHKVESFAVLPTTTSVSVSGSARFQVIVEDLDAVKDEIQKLYPHFSDLDVFGLEEINESP